MAENLILDFFQNRIVVSCFLAWFSAQFIKSLVAFARTKEYSPRLLTEDGGMPSSHSALVTALTAAVLALQGISTLFVVTLTFAIITLRDALGVRRAVGIHAKVLNKYIRPKNRLNESEGHSIMEVFAGIIIGILAVFFVFTYEINLFFIVQMIYLMLPGIAANMAPVLLKRYFNVLEYPLDFNLKLNKKPLLGPNKTIRGFIGGIIFSIVIIDIQTRLYNYEPFFTLSWIRYPGYHILLLGFLIGLGVMIGDAVKSFIKRRLNIEPGSSFFPWDQLDGAIGALILVGLLYPLPIVIIITILLLSLILHLLISSIGVALGLKKSL